MGRSNPWIVHWTPTTGDLSACGQKGQRKAGFAVYDVREATCRVCVKIFWRDPGTRSKAIELVNALKKRKKA